MQSHFKCVEGTQALTRGYRALVQTLCGVRTVAETLALHFRSFAGLGRAAPARAAEAARAATPATRAILTQLKLGEIVC